MKTFKLEADQFTINREVAEVMLSSPIAEENSKVIWDLITTSSVCEFEITHCDNPYFKASFEGIVHAAAIIAGVPNLTVNIVRPAGDITVSPFKGGIIK